MSAEFLITSIIVILVPGSGVLYTLALGIGRGWTAGVLGAVAGTLAILPHMAASIAGLRFRRGGRREGAAGLIGELTERDAARRLCDLGEAGRRLAELAQATDT